MSEFPSPEESPFEHPNGNTYVWNGWAWLVGLWLRSTKCATRPHADLNRDRSIQSPEGQSKPAGDCHRL